MVKQTTLVLFLLILITVVQLITLYFINRPLITEPYVLPKLIWVYWDTEELPPIIDKIKRYNAPSLGDWTVIYLNNTTLSDYVPATAYPKKYDTIRVAAKSDWLRLYLLSTYGGCWMDAGIIVNTPQAMNDLYNESLISRADLTCFRTGPHTFVHRTGRVLPKVIDSWCIMAPKESTMIKLWLEQFEKAIDMGFLPYKKAAMANGIDISAIHFDNLEDTYLTVHITIQAVVQNPALKIPPMVIRIAEDSMAKLQTECKYDAKCLGERMNNDPNVKKLPYIKLTRMCRKADLTRFFESRKN